MNSKNALITNFALMKWKCTKIALKTSFFWMVYSFKKFNYILMRISIKKYKKMKFVGVKKWY